MKNWLRLGLTEIKGNEIIRSESTGIGEAWGLPREKFISGMVWQYCLVITKIHFSSWAYTRPHLPAFLAVK